MRIWERIVDRLSATSAGATIEGRSPKLWEAASKFLYRYINRGLEDAPDVCFLNYGYAPLNDSQIPLDEKDEPDRIYIQLYHSVAGAVDLGGRNVLEMSCGRGGGAKYLLKYLKPRSVCGVDRSQEAVTFCSKHHAENGLRFVCGDAQAIPFADHSFDAVVNIEASHDYLDLPKFLSEVKRVLRPGGHLLYADFRKRQHCSLWREQLAASGLTVLEEVDISRNVVRGLELNTEHNASLVRRLAPWLLRPVLLQFAGVKGSHVHRGFASGKNRYVRFVFRKAMK